MHPQACLLAEAGVKDVHPDRQLTRSLVSEQPADAPLGTGSLHHDAADGIVRKRPGRSVAAVPDFY